MSNKSDVMGSTLGAAGIIYLVTGALGKMFRAIEGIENPVIVFFRRLFIISGFFALLAVSIPEVNGTKTSFVSAPVGSVVVPGSAAKACGIPEKSTKRL